MASASLVTRNRRRPAALAVSALAAVLLAGAAGAQTSQLDPDEGDTAAAESTIGAQAGDAPRAKAGGSDEPEADEAAGASSKPAEPAPVKPRKKISKPFVPTDRIDAESVVSFPADI